MPKLMGAATPDCTLLFFPSQRSGVRQSGR